MTAMRDPAFDENPWVYRATYVNAKGECHTVTVELTELERRQLIEYETYFPNHTGGPAGPIANRYVCGRLVPPDFKLEEIRRIPQSNVRALR